MKDINKFSTKIAKELKYYVYLLSDPQNGKVFYVGKGKGNRVFQHLRDTSLNDKTKIINKLQSEGLEPKIEILVHGIEDELTAKKVESAIIDLIGKDNLTNKVGGYESSDFGRMDLNQIIGKYKSEPAKITEPVLLIKLTDSFRYNMSAVELYDYTRGIWIVGKLRREQVKYVFCVYDNIVQETYKVLEWFKAGSTFSSRKDAESWKIHKDKRWEFVGRISHGMRKKYRYKSVDHYWKQGNRNPIRYTF